jgi:hypothetical protein
MSNTISKQEFLTDLQARNEMTRQIVQEEFVALDKAARSAQPGSGEWCVDQCFYHLVLTFDAFLPQVNNALQHTNGRGSSEVFKRSWFTSRNFYRRLFNPSVKAKTLPAITPSEHFYPDVFKRFLAQKEQMSAMLDKAPSVDLQARCWYLKFAPINLGDYFEQFVMHDELHIDQARRALSAYRQSLAAKPNAI